MLKQIKLLNFKRKKESQNIKRLGFFTCEPREHFFFVWGVCRGRREGGGLNTLPFLIPISDLFQILQVPFENGDPEYAPQMPSHTSSFENTHRMVF